MQDPAMGWMCPQSTSQDEQGCGLQAGAQAPMPHSSRVDPDHQETSRRLERVMHFDAPGPACAGWPGISMGGAVWGGSMGKGFLGCPGGCAGSSGTIGSSVSGGTGGATGGQGTFAGMANPFLPDDCGGHPRPGASACRHSPWPLPLTFGLDASHRPIQCHRREKPMASREVPKS